ncbi:hypothetical protein BTA51_09980 [Hahella sp. CCB-MM4]|uniref:hypothetical protein n=1 Tax=Hahella sp. (strain CCB-MM4) TaxID=1926491 RepID=UPI000B9A794D|nr:hypothetical protein [Hahella sp. CCB-MM4]OZG73352.1 hypothetical protein BTA51_09980 [Hahella sp. CCB-MM4]
MNPPPIARQTCYRAVIALTFLLFLLEASAEDRKRINYLVVEDLATPFQIASTGVHKGGIISDIVDEVFSDSDYEIKAVTYPVKRLHLFVRESNPGLWITYDAKVWNSMADVGHMIDAPLFTVKHSFLTCSPPVVPFTDDAALYGAQIAILDNFDYPELEQLASNGRLTLVPVENYQRGFNLVTAHRVSGFVEMEIRLKYNLKKYDTRADCLTFLDFSPIIAPYDIYLVVSNTASPDTIQFIRERILHMRESGEIKAILGRYQTSTD